MYQKQDIGNRILELAESGLEALEYGLASIEQGNTSRTLEVLTGAVEAFGTIEQALPQVLKPEQEYSSLENQVRSSFEHLVECCENSPGDTRHALKNNVLPSYTEWLMYLKDNLQNLTESVFEKNN